MSSGGSPVHDMIKPLSWLLGKWHSEDGLAKYPTMKDFRYGEELDFFHVGQPNVQFLFESWHMENKKPMHRETGFIRIKPQTNSDQPHKVAMMVAQNVGLVEIEEGEVNGQEMKTASNSVSRMTFGSEPKTEKISRVFKREGAELEQVVFMETDKTPFTEHLRIKYKKIV